MAWRGAVKSFMSSGAFISMIGGIGATGAYVMYTDSTRYPRMEATFARGNILPPLAANDYEIGYSKRPLIESTMKKILSPTFSNEYFIVQGPVGVGKTRMVVELIREMIGTRGGAKEGAPVYVLANQGRSFAESLANAVNFYFDEHVSFKFFLDFVLRVNAVPRKDEDNKLVRVLDAIEIASFDYLTNTGRPLVLVIDGLDDIARKSPNSVKMVQDKAKLWADTNSVKVIFICNSEDTERLLQGNTSNWSRAGNPVSVGDMSKQETIDFLSLASLMENSKTSTRDDSLAGKEGMPLELAEKVYDLVGGRVKHLIFIKRNWLDGVSFDDIAHDLMEREREKFLSITNQVMAWNAIGLVRHFMCEKASCSSSTQTSTETVRDSKTKSEDDRTKSNIVIKSPNTDIQKPRSGLITKAFTVGENKNNNNRIDSNINTNNSNNNNDLTSLNTSDSDNSNSDGDGTGYLLSKLIKKTSAPAVQELIKVGLLRCERTRLGVVVRFESRLTEHVINDLEKTYREEIGDNDDD